MLEFRICLAFCPIHALFVCAPSPSSVFLLLFCLRFCFLFFCLLVLLCSSPLMCGRSCHHSPTFRPDTFYFLRLKPGKDYSNITKKINHLNTGCHKKKSTINWTGEGKSTLSQGGTQKRSRTDSCKFFSSPALLLPGWSLARHLETRCFPSPVQFIVDFFWDTP